MSLYARLHPLPSPDTRPEWVRRMNAGEFRQKPFVVHTKDAPPRIRGRYIDQLDVADPKDWGPVA